MHKIFIHHRAYDKAPEDFFPATIFLSGFMYTKEVSDEELTYLKLKYEVEDRYHHSFRSHYLVDYK